MGVASRHSLRRVYLMTQGTLYLAPSGSPKILYFQLIEDRPRSEMTVNCQQCGCLAISCPSLLVVNQLQCHGLSVGVNA